MNDETIAALRGSIEHHERMRDGKGGMLGRSGCDLCRRFDWKCRAHDGAVCPVDEATSNGCNGTPYQELWHHVERHYFGGTAMLPIPTCAECVRLENAEIEFLRSLLPKGVA